MQIIFVGASNESLCDKPLDIPSTRFNNRISVPFGDVAEYLYRNEPGTRKDFFKSDGALLNGIFCLVDGVDASMDLGPDEDALNHKLIDINSTLVLISTLHGG